MASRGSQNVPKTRAALRIARFKANQARRSVEAWQRHLEQMEQAIRDATAPVAHQPQQATSSELVVQSGSEATPGEAAQNEQDSSTAIMQEQQPQSSEPAQPQSQPAPEDVAQDEQNASAGTTGQQPEEPTQSADQSAHAGIDQQQGPASTFQLPFRSR